MSNRVVFLVDGFDLYHSLRSAARQLRRPARWLDLRAPCDSYLCVLGGGATLEGVDYLSAPAHHHEPAGPGTVQRHHDDSAAVESTGVTPHLGRSQCKEVWCPNCGGAVRRYEEEETHVAVAARLLEPVVPDARDTAVIVSGDTDLVPAIRTAKRLRSDEEVCVAFPPGRTRPSEKRPRACFEIGAAQYAKFQLPDPVVLPDGRTIARPASW